MRDEILFFVENKISPDQHGFVKGKSCLSNLLETMDSVMELIEEGVPVDLIFFDFRKAFDRVPHNRLILKLQCLGIDGKVLDIIKDFLMGRTFRVSVQGEFSSFKDILSGIPQGSVLGPLLFILFINDLPDCLNSCVKIFADDLKHPPGERMVPASGETLLCAAPPLIAICRPYLEPARFARQNLSVETPFYLAQI